MRALALLLIIAGCGALPQPFFNRPGQAGAQLAQPPTGRLTILTPGQSLLPDAAAEQWAQATAAALVAQEVPAAANRRAGRGDWTLTLAAELRGLDVVPIYTVENPAGEPQGVSEAPPIPASAWAHADPALLRATAESAAPGIASLLTRIEAARRQSDPSSLQNRPARVWLAGVSGAPGDGDRSLERQMRIKLGNAGLVVQDTAKDADFKLEGKVATAPAGGGLIRVELQWIVSDASDERGRIVQLNEVPPRTIEPYWGDVAVAVASEAAGGVQSVIINSGGRKPSQPK